MQAVALEVDASVDQDRPRCGLALGAGAGRVRGSRRWRTHTARDASEGRGVDIHVRVAPLRVVQGVDYIGPKRERRALTNLCFLAHSQIDQEMARTFQIAQPQRPDFAWCGIRQQYLAGTIDNDTVGVNRFQIPGVGTKVRQGGRC